MGPKRQQYGKCIYPPIETDLAKVGLEEIGLHIARLQNMVAQYIATRTNMELCLAAERKLVL